MKIYGRRPMVLSDMSDSQKAGAEFEAQVYDLIKNMPEDAGRAVFDFQGLRIQGQRSSQCDFMIFLQGYGLIFLEAKYSHYAGKPENGVDQALKHANCFREQFDQKSHLYKENPTDNKPKFNQPAITYAAIYKVHTTEELVNSLLSCVDFPERLLGNELLEPEALLQALKNLASKDHEDKRGGFGGLRTWKNLAHIDAMCEKLVGQVEVMEEPDVILGEIDQFTDDQLKPLSANLSNNNPMNVIKGGAGTGKTVLAIQMAINEVEKSENRRVLLVTSSRFQKDWLTNKLDKPDRPELKRIDVRTPAQLEEMKSSGEGPRDFMIVDEGQDLMTEKFWNLADHFVRGGIPGRQWTWFMDDVNQVGVYGSAEVDIKEKLQDPHYTRWNLGQNFRNTKKIVETVDAQLGANIGSGSRITGDDPEIQFADPGSDYLDQCEKWLDKLLKKMRSSRKALVFLVDISSATLGNLGMEDLTWNKLKNRVSRKNAQSVQEHSLERYALDSSDNRILVTTPQRAKGLECGYAIIIGDPDLNVNSDPETRRAVASSLYVAMTRAQIRFHAFLPASWANIRINESVEA